MLLISTAKLVSALALCSALIGLVLADGPRNKCVGARLNFCHWRLGSNCAFGSYSDISCFVSPQWRPTQPFANVLFLVSRKGDTCDSIANGAGVGVSVVQSLNSGLDCTFLHTRLRKSN